MNRQTKWPAKILLNIWVLFLILLTYYAGYALGQLTGWHITFQLLAIFALCLGFGIFMDTMGPTDSPTFDRAFARLCTLLALGSVLQGGMAFFLDSYLRWPNITALVIAGLVLAMATVAFTAVWAKSVWK